MNTSTRNLSALLVLGTFAIGLAACNTMHGVGEDTKKVGDKIQTEADEHKDGDGATESSIQRPAQ